MPAVSRRTFDLRTFDQLIADVSRLRQGYDRAGQWSLEQVLDHLATTMVQSRDAKRGLPRPLRWLLRPIAMRLIRTRSMPRMPAPKSLRPPADVGQEAHQRFDLAVENAAALTADTVDHPAFGKMSLYDWQQLQLVHASRHLSFLIPRPPA